jgi:L-ribulose-5-phosphate 4-epimerase
MLLKELRVAVLEANLELVRRGLVLYTFGNASGVDREQGLVVIKPSGVDYDELRPEHMVVTDLEGKIVEGTLRPSSDLDTHTLLYREFAEIGAVVHTHSEFATSFAQAGMAIPERFHGIDPMAVPACLVAGHAPFVWGRTPHDAAHNAVVLEAVAKMAYRTLTLKASAVEVSQALLDRHYLRKHGKGATYGQEAKD